MMRKIGTGLAAFFAAAALFWGFSGHHSRAAVTTYYVCDCQTGADGDCEKGSDQNGGIDPDAPWQSYEKGRQQFANLAAGDAIRFCRGGAFDLGGSGAQWVAGGCTAVDPCTVADYTPPWASGDEPRPILHKTVDGHVFDLSNGGAAIAEGGYRFQNLDLRCSACSGAGWAFFLYNDVNDVQIDNVAMDGFGIGVHLAGANACAAGDSACNGTNDRITIRDVTIRNSAGQGILGGANDLLIVDSTLQNNGDGSVFTHNLYISGGARINIRDNELYQSSLDGGGSCSGTSLVGHGVLQDVLIEGNWVHEDPGRAHAGCWGIAITPAYDTAEQFRNLVIRGNRVENVGNLAIGTASCVDCVIENNVIVQQGMGMTGISVPAQPPGAGDGISSGLIVRNNSISGGGGTGISVGAGAGHTVLSNAMQGGDGWSCLDLPLAAANYLVVDYNVCDFNSGNWEKGAGDLTAWRGRGWGGHSAAAPPGFTSTTNLRPAAVDAALVGAGHPTLSSAEDFDVNGRPTPPSAGAYEWKALSPMLWLPWVGR